MAKRRTERALERAQRKLEKQQGMHTPSGESKYALTKRGAYQPKGNPHARPSWFVRDAALASWRPFEYLAALAAARAP